MAIKTRITLEPAALPGLSLSDILSHSELQALESRLERAHEVFVILHVARQDNSRSRRVFGN